MPTDLTSLHIERARSGDPQSREFLVDRFGPVLLAQANYRLRGGLRTLCEPEDLVQEVWLTVLPRLSDLTARDGRWTPVVLRFLATTLVRKINHLLRKRIAGAVAGGDATPSTGPGLAARQPGVVSHASRREQWTRVQTAIAQLSTDEQEVLVLRGIEQVSNQEIARKLGIQDYEATRRYQRALARLRTSLPESVFAEMIDA